MINCYFGYWEYKDGDILIVGKRQYQLVIIFEDWKIYLGKLFLDGIIVLKFSYYDQGLVFVKYLQYFLSCIVVQDFLLEIICWVDDFNDWFFQQDIGEVCLKYNYSNWGSCFLKGNINLFMCLLFVFDDVIDYVIIYELVYCIEMNYL